MGSGRYREKSVDRFPFQLIKATMCSTVREESEKYCEGIMTVCKIF